MTVPPLNLNVNQTPVSSATASGAGIASTGAFIIAGDNAKISDIPGPEQLNGALGSNSALQNPLFLLAAAGGAVILVLLLGRKK